MNYKEDRPWGSFEILYEEDNFKVKKIVVKPGKRLSLQSHKQRSENWVVIQGNAVVTLDEEEIPRSANQSVFIPVGAKHRIANIGEQDVVFIEVQTGSYLGENDIFRYEDDFNRAWMNLAPLRSAMGMMECWKNGEFGKEETMNSNGITEKLDGENRKWLLLSG